MSRTIQSVTAIRIDGTRHQILIVSHEVCQISVGVSDSLGKHAIGIKVNRRVVAFRDVTSSDIPKRIAPREMCGYYPVLLP